MKIILKNIKKLYLKTPKWKTIKKKKILVKKPWLVVAQEKIRLPNKQTIAPYYQIESPSYVEIIPLNKKSQVLLNLKYKHGVRGASLGFPSGYMERGESPTRAGKRELHEETGLASKKWRYLGGHTIDGNRGQAKAHFLMALDCKERNRGTEIFSDDLDPGIHFWVSSSVLWKLLDLGYFKTLGAAFAVQILLNNQKRKNRI